MRIILSLFLLLPSLLATLTITEEIAAKEHIKDYKGALTLAQAALDKRSTSDPLWLLYPVLLARCGKPQEALSFISNHPFVLQDSKTTKEIYEAICWSILRQGMQRERTQEQVIALLGAALTQDAWAIAPLCEACTCDKWAIRAIALELSVPMMDSQLQQLALNALLDPVQSVRLAAIRACVFPKALPFLQKALRQDDLSPKEEHTLIEAIVALSPQIPLTELTTLMKSPQKSQRLLACEMCCSLSDPSASWPLLKNALSDSCYDVQIAALLALGLTGAPIQGDEGKSALMSSFAPLSLTAAWWYQIHDRQEAAAVFCKWLNNSQNRIRHLAAAALEAAGSHATDLCSKLMKEYDDPFVKAQLGCCLLYERKSLDQACDGIVALLEEERMITIDEISHPVFHSLTNTSESSLSGDDLLLCSPKELDQMIRLKLLNLLAVVRCSKVTEKIAAFFRKSSWQVRTYAAQSVLREGDSAAIDSVKSLLNDPDPKVQLSAALVLGQLFQSSEAIDILKSQYPNLRFDEQLLILDTLGQLGLPQGWPLLKNALKSPSSTLRLAAACSLLRAMSQY